MKKWKKPIIDLEKYIVKRTTESSIDKLRLDNEPSNQGAGFYYESKCPWCGGRKLKKESLCRECSK